MKKESREHNWEKGVELSGAYLSTSEFLDVSRR